MILRKPYAFLIKYFKLIHAIMAACLLYLVYKTSSLMEFLNTYVVDQPSYVGTNISETLFNSWMFVLPVLVIVSSIIVMILMINKKKPFKFYIINILACIFVIAYYIYASSVIGELELRIVDIRIMRAVRDIIVAVYGIQLISTIVTFARATGFDIKQFDFGKDLKEMEISEADREELEVEINVDTDKTKRGFRKGLRYIKYLYLENKLVINSIVIVAVLLFGISSFMEQRVYNKTYTTTVYFNTRNFNMRIEDAYITNSDNKGNVITKEGRSLIVLRIKIKNRFSEDATLDIAKTGLKLGGTRFYPVSSYRSYLTDIGTNYDKQELNTDYAYYLLTYEVPTNKINEKAEFNYIESISYQNGKITPNQIRINLNLNNLELDIDEKNYNIGESISFENSILKSSVLLINDIQIAGKFKNTYNYCVSGDCFESIEYIKPSVSGNYDKTLIKLTSNITKDEVITSPSMNSLFKMIEAYGKIEYKINDITKTQMSGFKEVISTKNKNNNITYVEVNKEIEKASEIYLILSVRNQDYRIKLK